MSGASDDLHWMRQVLAFAALADRETSPNPRVGCLVVRDGSVVGRGYHRRCGEAHAESLALDEAGAAASGATLYVNLEPCAHQGRTPPCVDRIVRSGIRRLVASMQDPDPRVNGRGFEQLRSAGIEVETGLLSREAQRINAPFVHWHRTRRPLVTLKSAATLDGMISADAGESRWITGSAARRFAHRLRMRHDAILVGAGTVRRDNPRLTIRLPGVRTVRRRVVLSRNLDLPREAALFAAAEAEEPRVTIYTGTEITSAQQTRWAEVADIVTVPESDGSLELGAVLDDLGRRGVQALLVEGGARTFGSFLEAGLIDDVALFVASSLFGARGGTPLLDRPTVRIPGAAWRVERQQIVPLGDDLLFTGRLVGSAAGSAR